MPSRKHPTASMFATSLAAAQKPLRSYRKTAVYMEIWRGRWVG